METFPLEGTIEKTCTSLISVQAEGESSFCLGAENSGISLISGSTGITPNLVEDLFALYWPAVVVVYIHSRTAWVHLASFLSQWKRNHGHYNGR